MTSLDRLASIAVPAALSANFVDFIVSLVVVDVDLFLGERVVVVEMIL